MDYMLRNDTFARPILGLGTQAEFIEALSQTDFIRLAVVAIAIVCATSYVRCMQPGVPGARVCGSRSWWEPAFSLKFRFVANANQIISDAYEKFKDVPFVVRRTDSDVVVLPIRYLNELRLVSRYRLSCTKAQISNLIPRWTWTGIMMESDLHIKALTEKLNSNLNRYVDEARCELDYAWEQSFPRADDWTSVDIQQNLCVLIARMSAKVFVGNSACRNQDWVDVSVHFTHDLFTAAFTLRMFPPVLHWIVAPFIPARWRMRRHFRVAREIVGRALAANNAQVDSTLKEDALLHWMNAHGTPIETELPAMAICQCIMTLASIHTTCLTATNVLFDLCVHPQWFSVLLDELESVIEVHGMPGANPAISTRLWLQRLEKMDSFLVESQRVNPLLLLSPQRQVMTPLELSDGTKLPVNTKLAWASHHYANDPSHVADPSVFDPLRSYRRRHSGGKGNLNKFTAGQANLDSLSFGWGNQACPGRYLAINQVKLLLSNLLLQFEFRFVEGTTRPKAMYAEENVFLDPHAKIEMRRKPQKHARNLQI